MGPRKISSQRIITSNPLADDKFKSIAEQNIEQVSWRYKSCFLLQHWKGYTVNLKSLVRRCLITLHAAGVTQVDLHTTLLITCIVNTLDNICHHVQLLMVFDIRLYVAFTGSSNQSICVTLIKKMIDHWQCPNSGKKGFCASGSSHTQQPAWLLEPVTCHFADGLSSQLLISHGLYLQNVIFCVKLHMVWDYRPQLFILPSQSFIH